MSKKNYGEGLTRYLDPSESGFDTVVYQAGKPLLDSEFVLDQEIQNVRRAAILSAKSPSGWVNGDFDSPRMEDFVFGNDANTFQFINRPLAKIGGTLIPIECSGTTDEGVNEIELPEPPTGKGEFAADFVFLEVWRAVVGPPPSTKNKPDATRVYYRGNVLSPEPKWLEDDLLGEDVDPTFDPGTNADPDRYKINAETTKRIQVQYRIRTVRLEERTTRAAIGAYADDRMFAFAAEGDPTPTLRYEPVESDPGLWRAGDGQYGNELGTVDGYVYSIPIAIVYRRNQEGFNYRDNGNGSRLLSEGSNGHPDGVFADQIVAGDLVDLRNHVWSAEDLGQMLERNVNLLMAQKLRTGPMFTQGAGWQVAAAENIGTMALKADDIVPSWGNPYVSTPQFSGNLIGSVDGVRTWFSDKAVHESVVRVYDSGGANWSGTETFVFDMTSVDGRDITTEQPEGTMISDVLGVTIDEEEGGASPVEVPILSVTGLGTTKVEVEVDLDGVNTGRDIWVEYEVAYPSGSGLNAHVTENVSAYDIMVHEPSELGPFIGESFSNDSGGREAVRKYLWTEYEAASRSLRIGHTTKDPVTVEVYSSDSLTIRLHEELFGEAEGTDAGVVSVAIGANTYAIDSEATGGRAIVLTQNLPSDSERVEVTYYPLRPLPITETAITVYYKTNAIQAIAADMLPSELLLRPLYVPPYMYVGTGSSGSHTAGFPHEAGLQQIAVHYDAPGYNGEYDLDAPNPIAITGFDANTSIIRLPTLIPLATHEDIKLTEKWETTTEQQERMGHYVAAEMEIVPAAVAAPMSFGTDHKCFVPLIAQVREDNDFARAGEVVMVIFSNFVRQGTENKIGFVTDQNTTCAAIYHLKGRPLRHLGK